MMYDIMSREPENTCDSVGRVYHAGEADIWAWNFCRGCSIRSRVSVFRVRSKKTSDTIFRLVSLVCVFRRCRYCLPLQGGCSYHIRCVVWIGWDYWSV